MTKIPHWFIYLFIPLSFIITCQATCQTLRFAVIPKDVNNPFFLEVEKGCQEAANALPNVECLFKGPATANAISQHLILENLITQGIDGVAFSVILDSYVARRTLPLLIKNNIPFITFDSDIDKETSRDFDGVRKAYIGTNNFELGLKMGDILKQAKPKGGLLCIQTGRKNAVNLDRRIHGIRSSLTNRKDKHNHRKYTKLKNVNGWSEHNKCPIYSWSDTERALKQLSEMLDSNDDIAMIAVGGWAQYDKNYRRVMKELLNKYPNLTYIVADTTPGQLALLQEGLSKINIGQKPHEMGKQAVNTLYKIINKQAYEKIIYTELTVCTQQNVNTCLNTNISPGDLGM